MRILILNGAAKDNDVAKLVCNTIVKRLESNNHVVDMVPLAIIEIASCQGCFGCWLKTPGICVIPDAGRDIARSVVQSDVVITISPITFGGYSYHLKKALDRSIPIISPFFMKINGEVHHKPRYNRYPVNISIGLLPDRNDAMQQTFQQVVNRNALNMHSPTHLSSVLLHTQSVQEIDLEITSLLQKAGAVG